MRAARWLLGLSASFAVVASVASGCGGSTNGAAPIEDSGVVPDVTTEAAMEAAVEAAVEAAAPEAAVDAACVPDANIDMLPVPDASFGDAGATAASCLACFQTSCPTVIAQCNTNCACVAAFEQFGQCLGSGQSLIDCGLALAGVTGAGITETQLICALPCATPSTCGVTIPTGGDSGTSGDSATPGDAPAE
jgi:hypothetical protein